jgi:hypothetical protein
MTDERPTVAALASTIYQEAEGERTRERRAEYERTKAREETAIAQAFSTRFRQPLERLFTLGQEDRRPRYNLVPDCFVEDERTERVEHEGLEAFSMRVREEISDLYFVVTPTGKVYGSRKTFPKLYGREIGTLEGLGQMLHSEGKGWTLGPETAEKTKAEVGTSRETVLEVTESVERATGSSTGSSSASSSSGSSESQ